MHMQQSQAEHTPPAQQFFLFVIFNLPQYFY